VTFHDAIVQHLDGLHEFVEKDLWYFAICFMYILAEFTLLFVIWIGFSPGVLDVVNYLGCIQAIKGIINLVYKKLN